MLCNHPTVCEAPRPSAMVETDRPTCPMCASEQVHVRHTQVPVRYMRCDRCLGNFKMVVSYRAQTADSCE